MGVTGSADHGTLEIQPDRRDEISRDPPGRTADARSMPAQGADRVAILQAAIDALTKALATADDATIPILVSERAEIRGELRAAKEARDLPANVIQLGKRR